MCMSILQSGLVYILLLFKGRHPETLEDLELSGGSTLRTWPHMSHSAKLPRSKEARDNSLRRLPSSLDILWIFMIFFLPLCNVFPYPTVAGLRISFGSLPSFFSAACWTVLKFVPPLASLASLLPKDTKIKQWCSWKKQCRFRTAPQNLRRSPGIFQGKDSCSVSEK